MPRKGDFRTNSFWLSGDLLYIALSGRKFPGAVAIVDASDLLKVIDGNGRWYAGLSKHTIYARRNIPGGGTQTIHSLLIGSDIVDHKDGDGLNNRRSNIRNATNKQNCWNQRATPGHSKFKGVTYEKRRNRWLTQLTKDGKRVFSKTFRSEVDAARAYDEAALIHFGEYARLNFPQMRAS